MNIDLETLYLYILSKLPVRQLETFEKLRQAAGSFENVYLDPPSEFEEKLRKIKPEVSVEKLASALEAGAVSVLPYYEDRYPKRLKEIYDAPPVLFYRGNLGNPNEPCVAIVGARKMTSYGAAVMPRIAKPLINAGVTIVSGLAYGIDSAAHSECIKQRARTIAVLGSGVDKDSVYPRTHLRLAHDILDNDGLIISEHPPGTPGLKQNFIARNRIIAGLSLGVVIVECAVKSGALLTADYAADFNRNLYAVPGPVYSNVSQGPHSLIQQGAALITKGEEILEDLSLALPKLNNSLDPHQQQRFSELEQRVLECMKDSPATVDAVSQITKLRSEEISNAITLLELKGIIKNLGTEGFIKI